MDRKIIISIVIALALLSLIIIIFEFQNQEISTIFKKKAPNESASIEFTDSNGLTSYNNKVDRVFQQKVKPEEIIEIKLDVSIQGDETFYAIEEYVPEGFTIIDSGGGKTFNSNILKWVVIENAKDTTYLYTLKSPSIEGDYTFKGNYMFEGMSDSRVISKNTIITVNS
ncbi:MAG: hypothetical protein ABH811_02925 [archaeon]